MDTISEHPTGATHVYETILKQFLLAAVNEPQVQLFKTNKQPQGRFALYDALRKLRKSGDRFGK